MSELILDNLFSNGCITQINIVFLDLNWFVNLGDNKRARFGKWKDGKYNGVSDDN
jgi:hypothetical protein